MCAAVLMQYVRDTVADNWLSDENRINIHFPKKVRTGRIFFPPLLGNVPFSDASDIVGSVVAKRGDFSFTGMNKYSSLFPFTCWVIHQILFSVNKTPERSEDCPLYQTG